MVDKIGYFIKYGGDTIEKSSDVSDALKRNSIVCLSLLIWRSAPVIMIKVFMK